VFKARSWSRIAAWLAFMGLGVAAVVSTGLMSWPQADQTSVKVGTGMGHGVYVTAVGLLSAAKALSSDFHHHAGQTPPKPKASHAPSNRTFHSSGIQPAPRPTKP
jgi:hypothetical protein